MRANACRLAVAFSMVSLLGCVVDNPGASEPDQTTTSGLDQGHLLLPIESGVIELPKTLCEAADRLVAADIAGARTASGDFGDNDAARSEWELRMYGLRYAASVDSSVDVSDATTIHLTTLVLGQLERRTGYENWRRDDELVQAGTDLREVMTRLCPEQWADEILTKVVTSTD